MTDESQNPWGRLSAVHLTMHRRVVQHLNAAIGAVNLVPTDHTALDRAWQAHASRQLLRALSVFTAWNHLIRHKAGDAVSPSSGQRLFRYGDLLDWVAAELSEPRTATAHDDLKLLGARDMLQEALLLLHSCAFGLGPGVRLTNDVNTSGVTLGVRYRRTGPDVEFAPTLNDLLDPSPAHEAAEDAAGRSPAWRAEQLAFELGCARDFLAMNGLDLRLTVDGRHCALTFFVPVVRSKWTRRLRPNRLRMIASPDDDTIVSEEALRRALDLHDEDDADETQDAAQS